MFITLYASITWFRLNGYILSTHQLVRHPGEVFCPSLFAAAKLQRNVEIVHEIASFLPFFNKKSYLFAKILPNFCII